MTDFGNVLLVAFGIGLLIFAHEFGHFLAARWIGARVEVFSLGFGPRLFGFRRGPTDYRLSLIPLGGYVAVAGQDPGDHRHPPDRNLYRKSVGQRTLFYSGGVIMNLLFALVAFPVAFQSGVSFVAPEIGRGERGGAAWEADLQPGDRILAVAGKPMYDFYNMLVEVALAGGAPVTLRIRRAGEERSVEVRPQFKAADGLYVLGIDPAAEDTPPELAVASGGPAARAGLRSGDQLLAIDDLPATGSNAQLALARFNDPALDENGKAMAMKVSFRRGDREQDLTVAPEPAKGPPLLGVQPLPRIVGGVRPGLPALATLGIERGDVVLAIDGMPFRGPDLGLAATSGEQLTVVVRRGKTERTLTATVTADDRQQVAQHLALVPDPDGLVFAPMPGGAALRAGLRHGDHLVAIDGHAVRDWDALREAVQGAGERPLQIELERPGDSWPAEALRVTLTVQPMRRPDYGFTPLLAQKRAEVRAAGFGDAVQKGCVCSFDLVKQLYVTLKRLLTGDVAAKNLGGIIQISRVSYHNAQWGWSRFLYFLALLSINLAFINVLPIPVLDGGHLMFLAIEKIKGSPVSTRVLTYSQILGLVFVLALVVFVTYNDILRLL